MRRLLIILFLFLCAAPVQAGQTFYVRTTANSANSNCTNAQTDNDANAVNTIQKAIACASAADSDIIIVHGGTYSGGIANATVIPAGTSWANALTIRPATGENVRQTGGWAFNLGENYIILGHADGEWELDGTGLGENDGINIGGNGAHHIRVTNLEIHHFVTTTAGIHTSDGTGGFHEFLNNHIHHNGTDGQDHGIYIHSDDTLIEGNIVHNNAGYGITQWASSPHRADRNIIRNNIGYDNGTGGYGCAIGVGGGQDVQVYNNISYRSVGTTQDCGINIEFQNVVNAKVYNNTAYNTGTGILIGGTASGTIVRNNITWGNGANITNNGSDTICSNNLANTAVSGCVTVSQGSSPFTNAAAFDFTLASEGNLAVDGGTCLSTTCTMSVPNLVTDILGNSRPQGLAYDIGAYEKLSAAGDTLTLFNPNGGTLGATGSSQTFTWGSTGTIVNVSLKYDAANDGTFETTLSASTANDGSFAFTAPAATTTGRFQVCDASDGTPCDVSDSNVTITADAGGSITVIISDNTSGAKIGTINGTTNALLGETQPTTNFGAGSGVRANKFALGNHTHNIVKFPTSAIPSNATVTAAELGLFLTAFTNAGTPTIDFRNNKRAVSQSQATWNIFSTGSNWGTAGGLNNTTDRDSAVACNMSISATTFQYYTCSDAALTALVQNWVDGDTVNNGLHLERNGTGNDGLLRTFGSNAAASDQRPYLSVTYTTTGASISATQPISGSHFFPGDSMPVRWTSAGISGNVSVEISYNGGTSYQPTPIIASHPYDQADAVWTVSGPASTTARIKVCQGAVCGESPDFKIAGTTLSIR